MSIPVIDLFAGPGGLGEGFSSFIRKRERAFKIKLSIEKDSIAHRTLELRAFFRAFSHEKAPNDYYQYLRGEITREKLFSRFPGEAQLAKTEAWHKELGDHSKDEVDRRIKTALGENPKNWVLIGGPPCQAYSLLGRWRQSRETEKYESDVKHRLYLQYLHVIAVHRPPVFVMENVKGLLSTTVKSERMFDRIREDLQYPRFATNFGGKSDLRYDLFPLTPSSGNFKPEDFIIRAEEFGIPQARHRLIIVGIRSDWEHELGLLKKIEKPISIEEAIGDLPKLRSGLSKELDSSKLWRDAVCKIGEVLRTASNDLDTELHEELLCKIQRVFSGLERGSLFLNSETKPGIHTNWFADKRLKGVCNHETRSHIRADLHRYFFAAVFAKKNHRSPTLKDFPEVLLPKHRNIHSNKFADRFRVQLAGRPSTTVVSHISKDGHYYIHYDPSQCRSLTVREAARLQTFPDNYFFEGQRTQQYHQVGNAVPPLLANKIAAIIADLFD